MEKVLKSEIQNLFEFWKNQDVFFVISEAMPSIYVVEREELGVIDSWVNICQSNDIAFEKCSLSVQKQKRDVLVIAKPVFNAKADCFLNFDYSEELNFFKVSDKNYYSFVEEIEWLFSDESFENDFEQALENGNEDNAESSNVQIEDLKAQFAKMNEHLKHLESELDRTRKIKSKEFTTEQFEVLSKKQAKKDAIIKMRKSILENRLDCKEFFENGINMVAKACNDDAKHNVLPSVYFQFTINTDKGTIGKTFNLGNAPEMAVSFFEIFLERNASKIEEAQSLLQEALNLKIVLDDEE